MQETVVIKELGQVGVAASVVRWLVKSLFYAEHPALHFNTFFTGYLFSLNPPFWTDLLSPSTPSQESVVRSRIAEVNANYTVYYERQLQHAQIFDSTPPTMTQQLFDEMSGLQAAYYVGEIFGRQVPPALASAISVALHSEKYYPERVQMVHHIMSNDNTMTQQARLSLCLAVVNSATLYTRHLVTRSSLNHAVSAIRNFFIFAGRSLDLHSKLSILTHVGMVKVI